jgi:sterol 14alpha-demethylase
MITQCPFHHKIGQNSDRRASSNAGANAESTGDLPLPPKLSGGLPGVGHSLEFLRDPIGLLRRGREQSGELFWFQLAGRRVHVFSGPEAHSAFFDAPDDCLTAREGYALTVPIFGRGLIYDAEPHIMHEQFNFVYPGLLREQQMQLHVETIREETERYLAQSWNSHQGKVDLASAIGDLVFRIAVRCTLGDGQRAGFIEELFHCLNEIDRSITLFGYLWPGCPSIAHLRRDAARRRTAQLFGEILADRRRKPQGKEDPLQSLMGARYSDGRRLTDDEIVGLLIMSLFFAGQKTTAAVATWTALLLLQHPDYLATVRADVEDFGWVPTKPLAPARLNELVSLECAIKEAERLYPPLPILSRAIRHDFSYKRYLMPAGDMAFVSPALSNRLAEIFAEPDRYDPSRFASGREEDKISRYRLISFGGGTHRCWGPVFAHMEIKIILSLLLAQFDLAPAQSDYKLSRRGVWGPKSPCLVCYRRRL